ncbi:hypothetical protein C8F04DRAFT_1404244 [Mycena alexandri]|uniref:Uncharacterized protein n=1 Tax=Mycena alexandri TaxID=1745969 RepID=A0AAD6S1X2_9AGAR|nr:hypothetical protein C8F04DRAFT_1404244 [Mycena alexandri]
MSLEASGAAADEDEDVPMPGAFSTAPPLAQPKFVFGSPSPQPAPFSFTAAAPSCPIRDEDADAKKVRLAAEVTEEMNRQVFGEGTPPPAARVIRPLGSAKKSLGDEKSGVKAPGRFDKAHESVWADGEYCRRGGEEAGTQAQVERGECEATGKDDKEVDAQKQEKTQAEKEATDERACQWGLSEAQAQAWKVWVLCGCGEAGAGCLGKESDARAIGAETCPRSCCVVFGNNDAETGPDETHDRAQQDGPAFKPARTELEERYQHAEQHRRWTRALSAPAFVRVGNRVVQGDYFNGLLFPKRPPPNQPFSKLWDAKASLALSRPAPSNNDGIISNSLKPPLHKTISVGSRAPMMASPTSDSLPDLPPPYEAEVEIPAPYEAEVEIITGYALRREPERRALNEANRAPYRQTYDARPGRRGRTPTAAVAHSSQHITYTTYPAHILTPLPRYEDVVGIAENVATSTTLEVRPADTAAESIPQDDTQLLQATPAYNDANIEIPRQGGVFKRTWKRCVASAKKIQRAHVSLLGPFHVVLGGLAVGLLNFGDNVGKISAAMFSVMAMGIMVYALYIYHWRAASIRRGGRGPYDDRLGPVRLSLSLALVSRTNASRRSSASPSSSPSSSTSSSDLRKLDDGPAPPSHPSSVYIQTRTASSRRRTMRTPQRCSLYLT